MFVARASTVCTKEKKKGATLNMCSIFFIIIYVRQQNGSPR